jgi:Putative Actinobacterial Holin-X, holin superfamily III
VSEVSTGNQRTDLRERPLGEVAQDLTRDLSLLVRQEVALAKAEMAEKGRVAASGLGMIGGAGVVGLMAAGALTAFLILALSIVLDEWLSALIVGVALAGAAYVLAKQGKERVEEAGSPLPEQTIETVKEDVEWAKTRATSARK